MRETAIGETRVWELTKHFFRRFFENDVVESGGDVVTTVVRALSIVAAPGLMFAFWLQNQYSRRSMWGRVEDEYFFVMFSFVAMAGVAVFEWEMLFPDRLDFLVLSPLSLRRWEMPVAKALALSGFMGLFLVAANVFGIFMLPAVAHVEVLRQMEAHAVATLLAGAFGALVVIAMGGLLLGVLPARVFRRISPVVRMFTVTMLALLVVHYGRFGDVMDGLLGDGGQRVRFLPTFWFLGLYQRIQHGGSAPEFAWAMTRRAEIALLVIAAAVVVTYPVAWARMRRIAIEEEVSRGAKRGGWALDLVHAVVRRPEERAVFHFIGQTMARNSRYQVYMAMYFGTGLALAIACATRATMQHGEARIGISQVGLHAVMPLLVFWTVAGLKMAFGFPISLQAGWVFRTTGAELSRCVRGSKIWALVCSLSVMVVLVAALVWAGWSVRQIVVQAVCGVCLGVLLIEGFFFAQTSVPFSRPRRPGRTSLPLTLTLYIGALPPFVYLMMWAEQRMEKRVVLLAIPVIVTAVACWLMRALQERAVVMEEEREGAGGEFQLLGLAGELTS